MSKLCYEVHDDPLLDSGSGTILDVELAQFYDAECYSSSGVKVAHGSPQGLSIKTTTVWAWKYDLSL